jgi:hypothetical protein
VTVREQRQRFPNVLSTFVVLLALLDPAVAREASPPASGGKAAVLQIFHAGHFDLDLAIAECRSSECPIQVRLLRQGRVVDRVVLPVASSSRRARAESVDQDWGADPGLKAWATGVEGKYVSTVARLLTVGPQTTGLLVSQRFGFEHVGRIHLLVLPRDSKLDVVWKAERVSDRTWDATQIVGDPAGEGQEIVYFQVASGFDEDTADHFDAIRLRWDAASRRFRESPLPTPAMPLYLLNLGVYEDVAKARKEHFANSYCLSSYWIFNAGSFPGLSGGQTVIGKVYAQRSSAEAAARAVETCLPSITTSVLEWTATP